MTFNQSILAGTSLIRQAIQSPNYAANSAGWTINQDGSAEFNNIVIRGGTSVGSTSLWYNGTPTAGNLIFSISGTNGTDPFGNHYASGMVTYAVSLISDVALQNGNLVLGNADTDFANAGRVFSSLTFGGDVSIHTGTNASVGILDQVRANFRAGASSQPSGGALTPYFNLIDGDLTSAVDVQLSGSVIATDLSGNLETWHTPAYRANWVAGTAFSGLGGDGLHYRRTAEDEVWLLGLAKANAGAGTFVLDLPAGYHPIPGAVFGTPHGILHRDRAGAIATVEMAIDNTGQVILGQPVANGDVYSFNVRIPIGNLS